jgi:hypothetical protein
MSFYCNTAHKNEQQMKKVHMNGLCDQVYNSCHLIPPRQVDRFESKGGYQMLPFFLPDTDLLHPQYHSAIISFFFFIGPLCMLNAYHIIPVFIISS